MKKALGALMLALVVVGLVVLVALPMVGCGGLAGQLQAACRTGQELDVRQYLDKLDGLGGT